MFRMRVDQDFVAVEFRAGDVVVNMRKVGLARRQLGRAFQVQKGGAGRGRNQLASKTNLAVSS